MELRPYQKGVVDLLRQKIREGSRRVLMVSPTGSGKTVCASQVIVNAVAKEKSALFIAHRKELIDQASKKLDEFGVEHGVIKAGHKRKRPWEPVQVCSVQTLVRRKHIEADLVIIDEAHRAPASTYQKILDRFEKPPVIIGATATPYRSDGRGLGECFDDLAVAISPAEGVEQGYLISPTVFAASHVDLSKVKIKMGEYDKEGVADAMADIVLRGEIVENWKKKAMGACTVAFCVNVEHSKQLCKQFQKAGIKAAHLDGTMPDAQRERILLSLANREIAVVTNCNVLSEGYDLPILECLILAAPTQSKTLFKQRVGRIMRPDDAKRFAYVFDHCSATLQHGFVTDPERYDLHSPKRKGRAKGNAPSLDLQTVCVECSAFIPLRADKCPHCGHKNMREEIKIAETEQELAIIEPKKLRKPSAKESSVYEAICRECIHKGHKPGWVRMQYKRTMHVFPHGGLTPTPEFQAYIRRYLENGATAQTEPRRRQEVFGSFVPQGQAAWDF